MNSLVNKMRYWLAHHAFLRFLLAGAINTGLTWCLYLILLLFLEYKTSYTLSYITGLFISYLINRYFVFKEHRGISSILLFPLIYLAQYILGLFIVWFWVEQIKMSSTFAPIVSIIISIPITFVLSKFVFKKR